MNWNKQVDIMFNAWSEIQKKVFENFEEWLQTLPSSTLYYSDVIKKWQDENFKYSSNPESVSAEAAKKLLATYSIINRFINFASKTWMDISQSHSEADDWNKVLSGYIASLREELIRSAEELFPESKDNVELWKLYLKQVEKFTQPWANIFEQSPGIYNSVISSNGRNIIELLDLYNDGFDQSMNKFINSPRFGFTRELDQKLIKGFQSWTELLRNNFSYQVIMADTWIQAFEAFQIELSNMAERGEQLNSIREVINLWNNVADDVFIAVFKSEKFIVIQGKLIDSIMLNKISKKDIIELYLKDLNIASQREVEVAFKQNYLLKKEIKQLKKQINSNGSSPNQQTNQELLDELKTANSKIESLTKDMTSMKKSITLLKKQIDKA